MKAFILFLSTLFLLGGCRQPQEKPTVDVAIKGGGAFPKFLVGKWKAEGKSGWEINFADDGTVSSAVIGMGQFEVKPGWINTFPMRRGGESIIEPGSWLVYYDPNNRELRVDIVLDHIYMELGDSALEGNITDVIVGPVTKDDSTWQAVWTTFTNLTGHFPGQKDFDFSTDPNYGHSTDLVLNKVDE